ncbi:MAG: hypothetical protein RO469_16520 [Thermincola sp.]|nr:hypothetical protein [Thermincola sp.]
MEQKIFELMEKMYREMQNVRNEMDNGFSEVNNRLSVLESDVLGLKQGQTSLVKQVAQIENNLKPKVEAALDGYKVVYEKLEVIENKVDKLAETVENHDVKIEGIRKAK